MLTYQIYKLIHFGGLLLIFLAFGGMLFARPKDNPNRATLFALHGTGLLLMLVGGFGMLARLGIISGGFPTWVWLKLGVWIILGGFIALTKRKPEYKKIWIPLLVGLALAAGALALYKPGMAEYYQSDVSETIDEESDSLDPTEEIEEVEADEYIDPEAEGFIEIEGEPQESKEVLEPDSNP